VLKELSDTHFPQTSRIVLVQDNLSTHKPASLYEAFPAAETRRLVERFKWHSRPSAAAGWTWRNRTQHLVVAVSRPPHSRQADPDQRGRRVARHPQQNHTKADWQFTTADARIKLKRLYSEL
jgi:hypothetical protein